MLPATARVSTRDAKGEDSPGILACLREAFEEFRERYTPEAFLETVLTPSTLRERVEAMSVSSRSKEFLLLGGLQHLAILDATGGQHFDFGFLLARHIAASLGRNDKRLRAIGQIEGALELQGLHAALLAGGFLEGGLERVWLGMQLIGDLRWEHGHNHGHRRLDFDADLLAIMVWLEAAINFQE